MALKYHQGRCSASRAVVLATALLVSLSLHLETIHAATFTVVFNYNPSVHNVVIVDVNGYNSCTSSATSAVFSSGNDQVKLSKGLNYFICSIPGHCNGGLKITVNAS
ncbi:hypothetical protein ACSBR1_032870 [Camellia fascicularis]